MNAQLKPDIPIEKIDDFESIIHIPEAGLKEILNRFDVKDIVKASMGASPQAGQLLQRIYPDVDFRKEQYMTGSVRVEDVEEIQNRIVETINAACPDPKDTNARS